jgi:hypothetical protein
MSRVADTHNNPFFVDDETFPPQRSAFAVLLAERDDLLSKSPQELLKRAQAKFDEDTEVAAVYGKPITERDLKSAATRLENPSDRLVNELLDFRFHRFELESIPELTGALASFREAFSKWEKPETVDFSLVASILLQDMPKVERQDRARVVPEPPELPVLKTVLKRIDK